MADKFEFDTVWVGLDEMRNVGHSLSHKGHNGWELVGAIGVTMPEIIQVGQYGSPIREMPVSSTVGVWLLFKRRLEEQE